MSKLPLSWLILIFTLLEFVVKTHLTIYDSSHGFMLNSHERYIIEDISSIHEELPGDIRSSSINNLKLNLRFEPEFLDFKQRPLGVPHVEKVRLINTDSNRSIDMTSISGSTVHFHSSFFEDKKIPPLGNTTFNVVFLGREEGSIESSLFIHTTEGHLKYKVRGASVYSPYRLRPIVGVKLPINTSFSPLIYMHNPHREPIQIVEVYSSGGDFHLELPSGELEGPKDLWEIPPFETKAVIRVRFHARTEQNHTAYVRIKLNNTEEILVVPLEVEVTSTAGLFVPQGFVDFGVGGSLDPLKQVKLYLQNPLKKIIKLHSITSTSKAIKISFEDMKLPSDTKCFKNQPNPFKIVILTLDWNIAYETKDFSGKIIVKYNNGKSKTEIPYYITVVKGGISCNSSSTKYFINENSENLSNRNVTVKNDFPTSVMLINVSLPQEAQSYFHISDFNSVILKPKEEKCIFSLKLKSGISLTDIKLNSFILLRTNISEVEIPLLTYNGKLELHLPYRSKDNSLDLGLVSAESKKDTYILLLNRNPVSVTIKQLGTSLPASSVDLLGCSRGDYTNALLQDSYKNMTKCSRIKPSEFAILRLFIKTFRSEGQVWGDVFIHTPYELLSIPVHFKVAQGKLEIGPDRLVFDQCFPGKICSHPLRVHSTFNDPMVIEDIISIPPDPRLNSNHFGHIMARATKVIGHLYLDPNLECQNECYLGMQNDNTAQWLKTLSLTKVTPEFDLNLVNIFYNRYLNRSINGQPKWQNLTMRLDTSEVKGHLFKTRVKLSWPSLLLQQNVENKSIFNFPLTQVGNITYENLTIRNPSSHNLLIQLVMDHVYPDVDLLQEGLPPDLIPSYANILKRSNSVFFFHNMYLKQKESFEKLLNIRVHDNSLPVILYPGENFTVTIGYKSNDAVSDSSFIFIRNNLTVLEVVHLRGRGAHPNFKFGNRKPGSPQPLQFELTEKHLKDCDREKNRKYPTPNLTVKRSFTSRNTGDVTVFINSFYINGIPCEGYGFKVLNCEPFALAPNGTKKIDIAFTPDFTLSKISRVLILETSLNYPVNYTLMTTVPHYYLPLCTSVLSRPTWESYLYYSAICMMTFLLIFVVISMVLESDHIIKNALNIITRHSPSTQPTLDLRLIGAQTRSEIRTQKNDDIEEQKPKEKITEKLNKLEDIKSHKDEKYTALIPTTGKSKKKLTKKISNELISDTSDSKKQSDKTNKNSKQIDCKNIENIETDVTCVKKIHSKDRKFQKKKQEVKQLEVVTYEEETSSTTTESSNNEEIEKQLKVVLRKSNSKNETQKVEEREVNSHPKVERKRSGQKQNRNKEMKENIQDNKLENHKEHRTKSNKNKERKEKQSLSKKLSSDKLTNKHHIEGHTNGVQNISPTVSSRNIWGENRASFSDVVARNESLQNTTRLVQTSAKPMMYVEPYKQSTAELGPIGSRKETFWQDNVLSQGLLSCDDLNQMSAGNIFTETHNLAMESSNAFLDISPADNWQQRNTSMMNFIQPNNYSQNNGIVPVQDSWNANTVPNNYWDSILCNQMHENAQTQSISQDTWCSWGSPVWQPLSSEVVRTPTRHPPGFGFAPHREQEENVHQQQQENIYSPFSLREIWTQQQQSNPWNYPQGQ